MRRIWSFLSGIALLSVLTLPAQAGTDGQSINRSISGAGTIAFVGLGIALPLIQDGSEGKIHALRALDSIILAAGLGEGLKRLTHVQRPNSTKTDSFPSLHATAAFAVATMQAQYHPKEAIFWYAGAALISVSRVQLHEHRWSDVLAGAALGWGTSRLELSSHRGLLIYPIVNEDGGYGLMLSRKF